MSIRPVGPTMTTRPRTSRAAFCASSLSSRICGGSMSAEARAATISACERDCSFTSALTRSRRLSPSGTSSATMASTST